MFRFIEQLKDMKHPSILSSVRQPIHPTTEQITLPDVLHALGDPLRLRILDQLFAGGENMTCGDFQLGDNIAKSTASSMFKTLRDAGIIRMTPEGRSIRVTLRRQDMEACFPGLLETIVETYRNS